MMHYEQHQQQQHQQPHHHQHQHPPHYQNTYASNQYNQYQSNLVGYTQSTRETYPQVPPLPVNNLIANEPTRTYGPIDQSTDEADSPVLRALLNGKRPSANYSQSPPAKRQKAQESQYVNGSISPVRTEDSLDYFDEFACEKQRPIIDEIGYEVFGTAMTGENLTAASSIPPLTNHCNPIVDGISTPPQTPKSTENVNQNVSKTCDVSSGNDSTTWTQNGNECKYSFYIVYLNLVKPIFVRIIRILSLPYTNFRSFFFFSRYRQREAIKANIYSRTNIGAGKRVSLQSISNSSTSS